MKLTRPSHKELSGKLRLAREALAYEGFLPVDVQKLGVDFRELALYSWEDQKEALEWALEEVTPKEYKGQRPPATAFEEAVQGEEMFTFIWDSSHFQCKMYLKFCLVSSETYEGETLYVFSLHPDRPSKVKKRERK